MVFDLLASGFLDFRPDGRFTVIGPTVQARLRSLIIALEAMMPNRKEPDQTGKLKGPRDAEPFYAPPAGLNTLPPLFLEGSINPCTFLLNKYENGGNHSISKVLPSE